MCGRYTITVSWEELLLRYYIDGESVTPFHVPRYNVSPGTQIPAIINAGGQNRIGPLKWGLIPFWAKDEKIGYKMINARAETVNEKSFKDSFERKRCLIPADGFVEWQGQKNEKQPFRILMKDRGIFSMAGLYDTWTNKDGIKIASCTIITTTPNRLMEYIHDRMPVILQSEDESKWLDHEANVEQLQLLLRPYETEDMYAYKVSKEIGNVKNQGVELVEEVK